MERTLAPPGGVPLRRGVKVGLWVPGIFVLNASALRPPLPMLCVLWLQRLSPKTLHALRSFGHDLAHSHPIRQTKKKLEGAHYPAHWATIEIEAAALLVALQMALCAREQRLVLHLNAAHYAGPLWKGLPRKETRGSRQGPPSIG